VKKTTFIGIASVVLYGGGCCGLGAFIRFLFGSFLSINIDNKFKISKLIIYMSKTLWHTMTIKVPSEMVEITKAGKVSIKKTLTKMNNISRSQGHPSIKLVSSSDNKPHIITDGKEWNIEQLRTNLNKSNALAKKNKGRNILTNNSHSSLHRFKSNVKSRAQNLVINKQTSKPKTKLNKQEEIIMFLDKYKPLIINESSSILSESQLKDALNQLYNLKTRKNISDDDIKKWGDKYNLTYKSNRSGQKSNQYISEQRKQYMDSIKKVFFEQDNNNLIRDLENELERLKRQYSEVITTINIGKPTRELINLGLRIKKQHGTILNQLQTLTNKVYDKLPRYNFF
jgi:hypothetical protein